MIVARLLAKMEQAHATFATKAELEELRKLADALREELDALGVRVTNLEENVGRIDKRVTELERITFYGSVDTRVAFQSFRNSGRDAMRSLLPGITFNTLDYNAAVGSTVAAGGLLPGFPAPVPAEAPGGPPTMQRPVPVFNPFATGALTTTNWQTGRPLTSGTGFTMRGILGLNIKINDEIDAGAEFSAYSSQGDAIVDAYYGVQAPYLSNNFTATSVNGFAGVQPLNNQPFTRMTLDRFWIEHHPSKTKLILGAYSEHEFNDSIYVGMLNPNQYGPEHLENYGFLVDGEFPIDDEEDMNIEWQVMGTVLPDGNTGSVTPGTPGVGASYFSHAEGLKLALRFHQERGHISFNFLHAADDASNGAARTVGLIQNPNLNTLVNWVNPNGFYVNQIGGVGSLNVGGIGSTGDVRPVPTNAVFNADGSLAAAVNAGLLPQGVPNVGGVGPQDQTSYGIGFSYEFDNEFQPKIYGEYGHSEYRPQKNSSYSADGDAFKLGASALLLNGDLDVDIHYLSVDPRYSPFLIQIPTIGGISTPLWHTPDFHYFNNLYSLHNTKALPHNREGFRAKATWKFRPTGRASIEYGNLTQKVSSLQDVRFSTNSIAPGTPNTPVLGFSPGWMEPLFGGYHPATFAASGGNAFAVPLEDNKGKVENLYFSAGHKWLFDEANNNRGFTLKGGFKWLDFERASNMQAIGRNLGFPGAGTQAENQNFVDLSFVGWHVEADYDFSEDFTGRIGFTNVDIYGHLDPLGVDNLFAEASGQTRFNNVDITETWPEIGFDWEIHDDVIWSADARYYSFKDHVPAYVFSNPTLPSLNINNGAQAVHPFSWEGIQITSSVSVKF
ncbi:MAG: hypothetical protein AB7S38_14510 [Vulcanimicrobiota bacterium]